MKWSLLRLSSAGLALAMVASAASHVAAQDPPAQHTEAVALDAAPDEDQTRFDLSLGFTGNSGNTRAVAGNGGFTFLLKRKPHVFTLEGMGNLGYANVLGDGTNDLQRNAANVVGRARYDYFLSERDALFAAIVPRRDVFAGIGARIQMQAGYARVFYQPQENHRFWGELGGDATIDRYVAIQQEDGTYSSPIDTEIYSVRMFLGYTNRLTEMAELNLGFEALLPPYDKRGEDNPATAVNESKYRYRMTGNAELLSTLSSRFKMGAAFRIMYDNSPPTGTPSKIDTLTTFFLSYTYDTLAEKPAEAEEPACPPCEAAPEAAAATVEEPAPDPGLTAGEPAMEPVEPPSEATEAAAAEATEPAQEAVEAGEAAPAPAGTEEAPVEPPAPAAAEE